MDREMPRRHSNWWVYVLAGERLGGPLGRLRGQQPLKIIFTKMTRAYKCN